MKRIKAAALLSLCLVLCLSGCKGEAGPTGVPEVSPSASQAPENSGTDAPEGTPPLESADQPPETAGETIEVDGTAVPAERYESSLGYSILCPQAGITLAEWEGGQTFELTDAPGTYLAVSLLDVSNVDEAVAVVQFENAVESDPTGYIFGAQSYAGVRMTDTAGGLTVDYIILREGGTVYLLERAVFTGGEGQTGLLQSMLDSFTVNP